MHMTSKNGFQNKRRGCSMRGNSGRPVVAKAIGRTEARIADVRWQRPNRAQGLYQAITVGYNPVNPYPAPTAQNQKLGIHAI